VGQPSSAPQGTRLGWAIFQNIQLFSSAETQLACQQAGPTTAWQTAQLSLSKTVVDQDKLSLGFMLPSQC